MTGNNNLENSTASASLVGRLVNLLAYKEKMK